MSFFDPPVLWLLLGLLLALADLAVGSFVLLALGAAAIAVAIFAALGAGFTAQLIAMAVLSGLLIPLSVTWIKPIFSPKGVGYGTTGAGAEQGRTFTVQRSTFDESLGVRINGDFYRARPIDAPDADPPALTEGQSVQFVRFDGTLALVRPQDNQGSM